MATDNINMYGKYHEVWARGFYEICEQRDRHSNNDRNTLHP